MASPETQPKALFPIHSPNQEKFRDLVKESKIEITLVEKEKVYSIL